MSNEIIETAYRFIR